MPETTTGHVQLDDLSMYYEIHGSGGTPLLLLHGGLFDLDQQFGAVLPGLAEGRQVIATDFQGHGRTNDIDRPLGTQQLAGDVAGLLAQLGVGPVDVWGFSVGGAVGLHLAIKQPSLVRRLVVSSVSYHPTGERTEFSDGGEMKVEMIAGTPMEQAYLAKSPHPDLEHLQALLTKLGKYDKGGDGWSEDEIRGIAAPTLFTAGDNDAVKLEHAVRFAQLRGGDVNADFVGLPPNQLLILPGTTHFTGMAKTDLILPAVTQFLDA